MVFTKRLIAPIRFHYLPPGAWDVQRTSWSLPMKPKDAPPPDVARLLETIPPDVRVLVARVRRLLLAADGAATEAQVVRRTRGA
jgi:hypothetical protein